MKNLLIALFIMGMMAGCGGQMQNNVTDYKVVRDEVMQFHDLVMADHGTIVQNQMKLDTLLKDLSGLKLRFPELDTVKEKANINALVLDLVEADDAMNEWMHKFEPDVQGKSNEHAIDYFNSEKSKIAAIDSIYKSQIKITNDYLNKMKP